MHQLSTLAVLCWVGSVSCVSQPFLNWMSPTGPTYKSQTDAEATRGLAIGRFPGPLELLQPTLDPGLASYSPTTEPLRGNYTLAASDVLASLSRKWVDEFVAMYPNVTMTVPPPYAGSLGAIELIKGTLQGVFVSRELKPSDVSTFRDAFHYDPTSVPIAGGSYRQFGFLDAMSFVVHKDNPIEALTFAQLDSIFSTTRARGGKPIRKWSEVGVVGPLADQQIKLYGITPWNGFEEFIRQRVLSYNGTRGEWRSGKADNTTAKDPDVTWDATVFNISRHVSSDPAAIGYSGLAYLDSPVKVIATYNDTTAALVAPTYENIARATWPLARVVYFNTNTDPARGMDPVLRELQRYVVSRQGQKVLLDQGVFLPFRAYQQQLSLARLK